MFYFTLICYMHRNYNTFLIIITKKGNLMPSVYFGSAGAVIKFVLTFVPIISKTVDYIS